MEGGDDTSSASIELRLSVLARGDSSGSTKCQKESSSAMESTDRVPIQGEADYHCEGTDRSCDQPLGSHTPDADTRVYPPGIHHPIDSSRSDRMTDKRDAHTRTTNPTPSLADIISVTGQRPMFYDTLLDSPPAERLISSKRSESTPEQFQESSPESQIDSGLWRHVGDSHNDIADLILLYNNHQSPDYVPPRTMSVQLNSMVGQISTNDRHALRGSLSPYLANPVSYIQYLDQATFSVGEESPLFWAYVSAWIFMSVTMCRLDGLRLHFVILSSPSTLTAIQGNGQSSNPSRLAVFARDNWFANFSDGDINKDLSEATESLDTVYSSRSSQASDSTESRPMPTLQSSPRQDREMQKVRLTKASQFFVLGRVFDMRWYQWPQMESSDVKKLLTNIPAERRSKSIHSYIRRFVVVKAKPGYCYALPIYNIHNLDEKESLRPQRRRAQHPIVYDAQYMSEELTVERRSADDAIPVDMEADESLSNGCRLDPNNLKKITWNTRVRNVGTVTGERHLQRLRSYLYTEILPVLEGEKHGTNDDKDDGEAGRAEEQPLAIMRRQESHDSMSEYIVVPKPNHLKHGPRMRRVASTQEYSSNELQQDYLANIIRFAKGLVNSIPTTFGGR